MSDEIFKGKLLYEQRSWRILLFGILVLILALYSFYCVLFRNNDPLEKVVIVPGSLIILCTMILIMYIIFTRKFKIYTNAISLHQGIFVGIPKIYPDVILLKDIEEIRIIKPVASEYMIKIKTVDGEYTNSLFSNRRINDVRDLEIVEMLKRHYYKLAVVEESHLRIVFRKKPEHAVH